MSRFVKSLKRLYTNGRITQEVISTALTNGEITQEEYDYIVEEVTA